MCQRTFFRVLITVCLVGLTFLVTGSFARADVVVFANRTDQLVKFEVVQAGQARKVSLDPGAVMPVATRGPAELCCAVGSEQIRYELDANAAYYFVHDRRQILELRKINLGGDTDTFGGRQLAGGNRLPDSTEIPVKVLVDDGEPSTRQVWEPRVRKRIAAVSDVLERCCRVRLKVVAVERWHCDDSIKDVRQILTAFREQVDPRPGRLAIGFTSKFRRETGRVHLGGTQGLLRSHIMVGERSVRMTEPERMEILLHEVGHFLGAVHSPDPSSVMRPILADDKAVYREFPIRFDPINVLIMYLVGEELRAGVTSVDGFSEQTRLRLGQIYGTLAKATRDDYSARQMQFQLGLVKTSPLAKATRRVVAAVVRAASEKRVGPIDRPDKSLRQDDLAEYYVRHAAREAAKLPEQVARSAFVLGLGVALDSSNALRGNPLTREFCSVVESADERRQRRALVKGVTVRGRTDLAQHFFLSAYLTAIAGPVAAEGAGLAKELLDAKSGSGFSYVDLAADLAGIAFAQRLLVNKSELPDLATNFTVADHMPDVAGLPEGLDWTEVRTHLTGKDQESLAVYRKTILQRIRNLPAARRP